MGLSTVRTGTAPVCGQGVTGTGRSVGKQDGQQAPTGSAQLFDASTQHFKAAKKKNFRGVCAREISGLQPESVYKVSSSVNNSHFLWISLLTDEKSIVYTRYKPVVCCCIAKLMNLDNFLRR